MAIDLLAAMRVFTKVVELENFSKAAEKLNLSPGMTSRYVAQLEGHLGVRLLNRTTRHLSLTAAGSDYCQHALQVLALVEQAAESAVREVVEPRGTLRVTSSLAFGGSHLGEAVATYLSRQPQVTVDIMLTERIVDLVEEGVDLAIRVAPSIADGLIARPICPARFIACAAPSYLRERGVPTTPDALTAHNCLTFGTSDIPPTWRFSQHGQSREVRVQGSLHGNNGNILCRAAEQGLGIIYQPTFLVYESLRAGQLVPLLPDWAADCYTVYAVYPHRQFLPQKVRSFIDFLVARFGPEPYWDQPLSPCPPA
jgi:DNA-binding transcriptional LysR family regulator